VDFVAVTVAVAGDTALEVMAVDLRLWTVVDNLLVAKPEGVSVVVLLTAAMAVVVVVAVVAVVVVVVNTVVTEACSRLHHHHHHHLQTSTGRRYLPYPSYR
jgi:hypothetical protein